MSAQHPGEFGTPDFDALGRETLWPAEQWHSTWSWLADQEHRETLWPAVVALSAGGTPPSTVAIALVQASVSGGTEGES